MNQNIKEWVEEAFASLSKRSYDGILLQGKGAKDFYYEFRQRASEIDILKDAKGVVMAGQDPRSINSKVDIVPGTTQYNVNLEDFPYILLDLHVNGYPYNPNLALILTEARQSENGKPTLLLIVDPNNKIDCLYLKGEFYSIQS